MYFLFSSILGFKEVAIYSDDKEVDYFLLRPGCISMHISSDEDTLVVGGVGLEEWGECSDNAIEVVCQRSRFLEEGRTI